MAVYRRYRFVAVLGLLVSSAYIIPPLLNFGSGLPIFRAGPEKAEEWLNRYGRGRLRYECRDGEKGWDYICTEFRVGPEFSTGRIRVPEQVTVGVTDRYYGKGVNKLPEGPIPTREAFIEQSEQQRRDLKERIDLNTARSIS
jgi:hypothetical protein